MTAAWKMAAANRLHSLMFVVVWCFLAVRALHAEEVPAIAWTRQSGTSGDDLSKSVAVDANGNAYISGWTNRDLDGNLNEGNKSHTLLTKYDPEGNKLWTRQMGRGESTSVAVDTDGNVYISGFTGNTNAGGDDAFLAKFDADGNKLWSRLLGTNGDDRSWSVAVDANGNAYISGITEGDLDDNLNAGDYDAFLAKYDPEGNKLWTRLLGTSNFDSGSSVTVDANGNAYISGFTAGDLNDNLNAVNGNLNRGIFDAFLAKYDPDGNKVWTRLLGTSSNDFGTSVAVDANGNAYISGSTNGGLDGNSNAGSSDPVPTSSDAFLAKYDPEGNKLWTRQLGHSGGDICESVAVDANGNAYICGRTGGDLDGNSNAGEDDVFLTKYDPAGNKLWTMQLGTSDYDNCESVAVDANGNAYISGWTTGNLGGNSNAGNIDLFLIKLCTGKEQPKTKHGVHCMRRLRRQRFRWLPGIRCHPARQ